MQLNSQILQNMMSMDSECSEAANLNQMLWSIDAAVQNSHGEAPSPFTKQLGHTNQNSPYCS